MSFRFSEEPCLKKYGDKIVEEEANMWAIPSICPVPTSAQHQPLVWKCRQRSRVTPLVLSLPFLFVSFYICPVSTLNVLLILLSTRDQWILFSLNSISEHVCFFSYVNPDSFCFNIMSANVQQQVFWRNKTQIVSGLEAFPKMIPPCLMSSC